MEQVTKTSLLSGRRVIVSVVVLVTVLLLLLVWRDVLSSWSLLCWGRCMPAVGRWHPLPAAPTAAAQATAAAPAAAMPDWPPLLKPPSAWAFKGVQLPQDPASDVEGDIRLVPPCNATYVRRHPLAPADYSRSYTPGDPCLMPPGLLQRLQTGEAHVSITAVGGSMTAGMRCFDGPRANKTCAWPSRLQQRLLEVFPRANVTVVNAAIGSFGYTQWVHVGLLERLVQKTDLIIVDAQVNSFQYGLDAYTDKEEADVFLYSLFTAARRQQRQVGVLFVETFSKTCGFPRDGRTPNCKHQCDSTGRHGVMHTTIQGHRVARWWCNSWWTVPDIERPVVRHYKLPVASFRDAIWPNMNSPRPDLPCLYNGNIHPGGIAHSVFADVVAYGLIRAIVDSNSPAAAQCVQSRRPQEPQLFHAELPLVQYCSVPVPQDGGRARAGPTDGMPTVAAAALSRRSWQGTFMSSFARDTPFQPVNPGSWVWREDVSGKPGWIYDPLFNATTNTSSGGKKRSPLPQPPLQPQQPQTVSVDDVIWFKVLFSDRPQLQVTYLASYKNFGAADLTVHNASAVTAFDTSTALQRYRLAARHTAHVSVPITAVLNSNSTTALQLPPSVGQGEYLIALQPKPFKGQLGKFKLLGITSC